MAEQNLDERPDLVLGLVADQLAAGFDPERTAAALAARRAQAGAQTEGHLHSPADRARFARALERAAAAYPVREDNEYFTVSAPLALIRRAALEAGRRLAERGQIDVRDDVFELEPDEVLAALHDRAGRHGQVTRAKGERAWVMAHPGPATYGKDPRPAASPRIAAGRGAVSQRRVSLGGRAHLRSGRTGPREHQRLRHRRPGIAGQLHRSGADHHE